RRKWLTPAGSSLLRPYDLSWTLLANPFQIEIAGPDIPLRILDHKNQTTAGRIPAEHPRVTPSPKKNAQKSQTAYRGTAIHCSMPMPLGLSSRGTRTTTSVTRRESSLVLAPA